MRSKPLRVAAALLSTILAGCAPLLREPAPAPAVPPADFPEDYYREALGRGKPVFRVDPRESLVVIEVRRAGSLARLGHDHVVASHEVGGYVAPDEGRADLYVALGRLAVDEAALRTEAGFDTQPAESDIEGTRAITLHGSTRTLQAPARIDADVGEMSVTGRLSFDQTDFGITPYSLLGVAIAVKNGVELRFRIRARRLSGAG